MNPGDRTAQPPWALLSNHGHVLVCIASGTDPRLREVAERLGITERAVQRIVGELEAAGYVDRRREGRRNRYLIHPDAPLQHPLENSATVKDVFETFSSEELG